MVYDIVKVGEQVLREKTKAVEEVNDEIRQMMDDMAETMYKSEGVGLAAPQIGVSKKVIVVDVGEGLIQLANPKIIACSGEQKGDEGCLSIPGVFAPVIRYDKVTVTGLDRNSSEVTIEATGFKARALQHEIDHLDGILFVDKLAL